MMGAALVGGALGSLGIREASADLCKRDGKECKKNSQCCNGFCERDASGNGICATPECRDDSDCDDFNECTTDVCNQGVCEHEVIEEC